MQTMRVLRIFEMLAFSSDALPRLASGDRQAVCDNCVALTATVLGYSHVNLLLKSAGGTACVAGIGLEHDPDAWRAAPGWVAWLEAQTTDAVLLEMPPESPPVGDPPFTCPALAAPLRITPTADQPDGFIVAWNDRSPDDQHDQRVELVALNLLAGLTTGALRNSEARRRLEAANAELEAHQSQLRAQQDDLKQINAALTAAHAEAEEATAAKGRFLAALAHEVRTPLAGVVGAAQLLAASGLTPQQEQHVGALSAGARMVLALLDNVLDYSRFDAVKPQLERTTFPLHQCIHELVTLVRAQATAATAVSAVIDADTPTEVCGDPTRLRQVLLNLLSNAVKFTPRGSVTLEAGARDVGDAIELRFTVRDTGVGMTAEQVAKLFRPFAQATPATARQFGGSGLGLHISKQLANAMGGGIDVESKPGVGSVFRCRVLVERASEPPDAATESVAAASPMPSGSATAARRVLVVDDSTLCRSVLIEQLRHLRHRAQGAADDAEALCLVRREPIDLVLLDLHGRNWDGCTLAQTIRQSPLPQQPYIVALSGDADPAARRRSFDAGMDDFLLKPAQQADLLRILEDVPFGVGAQLETAASQATSDILGGPIWRDLSDGSSASQVEFLTGLFAVLDAEAPPLLQTIADHATRGGDVLRSAAHALKGCALNIGALHLAEVCEQLEEAGRNAKPPPAHLAAAAAPAYEAARAALRQRLRELEKAAGIAIPSTASDPAHDCARKPR